ncbi:MAG: hypothetical protein ERJ68_02655 [Aphanocapsa feldmannii 277cI]|uniref:Uncharacterized protein n=1 Tax=Aphanocapsa feldmannii 277cI TaxID=2507554 RepID=A0A524RUQ0_9CHRO|nr:MAG: hypothetical protein ERJ68_02655 [Aphanocapsa feldmannii 277cI]
MLGEQAILRQQQPAQIGIATQQQQAARGHWLEAHQQGGSRPESTPQLRRGGSVREQSIQPGPVERAQLLLGQGDPEGPLRVRGQSAQLQLREATLGEAIHQPAESPWLDAIGSELVTQGIPLGCRGLSQLPPLLG